MLKHLELRRNITAVGVGCGAGFPLLELAERLGTSCKLYGVDPWKNAADRARKKVAQYGIINADIIDCSAAQMPFNDSSIDLIVSNLGINNFEEPSAVFMECHRVLKQSGTLALTTNLNGHWWLCYDTFKQTLKALGEDETMEKLERYQEHRGSVASISTMFTDAGFRMTQRVEESFEMRFLDGTAFLNHHFIKPGWLLSWKALLPEAKWESIFTAVEADLNRHAANEGSLRLTVPMAFISARK